MTDAVCKVSRDIVCNFLFHMFSYNIMSSVEFCSLAEYQNTEKDRIQEAQLCVGSLYTVFYRLGGILGRRAARLPAIPVDMAAHPERPNGLHIVGYTLLDQDLKPFTTRRGAVLTQFSYIHDGYLSFDGEFATVPRIADRWAVAGYFAQTEDPFDLDAQLEAAIRESTESFAG